VAPRKSAVGDPRSGSTLLEVVVAFAILGLLLGLVWPNFRGHTSRNGLRAAALHAESFLREARLAARRGGRDITVLVDRDRRRLVAGDQTIALPADVSLGYAGAPGCGRGPIFYASGASCGGALALRGPVAALALRINGASGDVSLVPAPSR
jgi:general secretion pathway protein H